MKLLSTSQAAELIGVNDSRIRQLIRDGQIQAVQVGRAYLLDESIVKAFERPQMGRPKKAMEVTTQKPKAKAEREILQTISCLIDTSKKTGRAKKAVKK